MFALFRIMYLHIEACFFMRAYFTMQKPPKPLDAEALLSDTDKNKKSKLKLAKKYAKRTCQVIAGIVIVIYLGVLMLLFVLLKVSADNSRLCGSGLPGTRPCEPEKDRQLLIVFIVLIGLGLLAALVFACGYGTYKLFYPLKPENDSKRDETP